ncbi:MAG TPA: phage tail protein I [Anaerolineales bacterium]|nr:phage tail protein I [Anaerolineales bacterium]
MSEIRFTLKIEGPDGFGVDFEVPQGATQIGRQAGNDLVLAHTQVSRNHARLDAAEDSCSLTDLGSSNGSYVNGEKLEPNAPRSLQAGDRIKIGPFQAAVDAAESVGTAVRAAPAADPSIVSEIEPAPEEPVVLEEKAAGSPGAARPKRTSRKPAAPPEAATVQPVDGPGQEAPPPTPPGGPRPPGPVAVNGHPGAVPGLTRYSSVLMDYLPGIYHSDFMSRFLGLFEATLLPVAWTIDNFDQFLDPETSPAGFLPWLASWYGLAFDSTWSEAQRRRLIAEAHAIYTRRGTRWALTRVLEIYTGVEPEIDDVSKDLDPFTFSVSIPVRKRDVRDDLIEALIDAHKPAHTSYSIKYRR